MEAKAVAGMKIEDRVPGTAIVMPLSALYPPEDVEESSAEEAEGLLREKVRSVDITSDVRFSSACRELGSVLAGWMVAWCGMILGRDISLLGSVVCAEVGVDLVSGVTAISDCGAGEGASLDEMVLGAGIPVMAVHMSST